MRGLVNRKIRRKKGRGSVLVGLLWCLAILSVLVIGILRTSRMDLLVVKNYGDQIQAHYLALAGIEKAKALLFQDARDRKRSAKNHGAELYDAPQQFRDISLGRGRFRVFHQGRQEEGGGVLFGISDEESRLNLNTASAEDLAKLRGMTPDVSAAILDWRDSDNDVTPGGAEADYYASLASPSLPRNGPLQTTRELLMVRGVPRDLFLGEDANGNGLLDPEEDDGDETFPPDNRDGMLDAGWSGLATVDSLVQNKNAAGEDRVNVQTADEKSLTAVRGLSAEMAKAMVAYRAQNQLQTLADLLEVRAMTPQDQQAAALNTPNAPPGGGANNRSGQPGNRPAAQPTGPNVISQQQLMDMADDLTAGDAREDQPGAISINTASPDVLACLPGVSPELARAIVSYRRSAGFFPNIAFLLKVDGMTPQIFKQMAGRVCARSETFRILSEGKIPSTGARKRIQVIVRIGSSDIETLSYREDL